MADFNANAKSFINGLSDFWTVFFKQYGELDFYYKGAEIDVGQTYLDLLGLLLNNSVQDTLLFNKNYFKLLNIRETDITYQKGITPEDDRYVYTLPDGIIKAPYLNNKILAPNASLERNIDYFDNGDQTGLLFKVDPTNAYAERVFGAVDSALRIRAVLPGIAGLNTRIFLSDVAVSNITITRTDTDVLIQYRGPLNGGTDTAEALVAAINTNVFLQGFIVANIAGTGRGVNSPAGTLGFVNLLRAASNPLDSFANRTITLSFGGRFYEALVSDWLQIVQKGDLLRIFSGAGVGSRQDYPITLVRRDSLYTALGKPIPATAAGKVDYTILRKPADNTVIAEPFSISGAITGFGVGDGSVVAATATFSAPAPIFFDQNIDDIIEIYGASNPQNNGAFRIISITTPFQVVLGSTGFVNEPALNWNLYSTVNPSNNGVDGTFSRPAGVAQFTASTALFTLSSVGKVLRLVRGGVAFNFEISELVNPTTVNLIDRPDITVTAIPGTESWGVVDIIPSIDTLAYSPPAGVPVDNTVMVVAQRALDNAPVQEGRDYRVDYDLGKVTPITPWRTSLNNTVDYSFYEIVFNTASPLQTGVDGTITPGTPNVFSSPTAAFVPQHVGMAIRVTNSSFTGSGPSNNGVHFIASVVNATTVTLTADKQVPSTPDANNGTLGWNLLRRGATQKAPVLTDAYEVGLWAPDVLIDQFNLYNTYGYLINRFERSSEQYRTLIRGIFQLFMLGPTLERFESAVNTVAGLPVIRDDGEILLGYVSGATQSGADGSYSAATLSFTSPTASFVLEDIGRYIFAPTGANAGQLFRITAILSTTSVQLDRAPSDDAPTATWELTTDGVQDIQTSRAVYSIPRGAPIKPKFTNPLNFGVAILKAFEAITAVFTVTDYVESPRWWEDKVIPPNLLTGETVQRRQSSPALVENVLNPSDDGRIGDPGYLIGADSYGFIPRPQAIRPITAADGILIGDPNFPFTNNCFFSSPTGAFVLQDVGNLLETDTQRFRILNIVSPTTIQIESFVPLQNAAGVGWRVATGSLPMRNKMAFVVIDKFLKYHTFLVKFDASLLAILANNFLDTVQELVFVAKPSYTYILVEPALLFNEVIRVEEDEIDLNVELFPAGGGELIGTAETPLAVIGTSWRIGSWFRNIQASGSAAAPATLIAAPFAALLPTPGYDYAVNKFTYDTALWTQNTGRPVNPARVSVVGAAISGVATLTVVADEATLVTTGNPFKDADLLGGISITSGPPANIGTYTIGAVSNPNTLRFSIPGGVSAGPINWQLQTFGGVQGNVKVLPGGISIFTDLGGRAQFTNTDVGSYVNIYRSAFNVGGVYRIHEIQGPTKVRLAEVRRVDPDSHAPDAIGQVDSNVLSCTYGDVIFSQRMCSDDRRILDPNAFQERIFYVVFTSGPNTGQRARLVKYLAGNKVQIAPTAPLTVDPAVSFYIQVEQHYRGIRDEITDWEIVRDQIVSGTQVVIDVPSQDVSTINYVVYGVREPIDPTTAIFDATSGDTRYSVGMPNPKLARGRLRSGRNVDMIESPISIRVFP